MRLFASADVISRAEEVMQRIAETYRLPNRDFRNPDRQPGDVDLLRALANLAVKTRCLDQVELQGFSAIAGLHLCEAAIHKQFRSRDVAAVVGCEKHDGLRDLIRSSKPTERNGVGNHLQAFLARFPGSQQIA